jgi:hypothetical protein
MPTDPDDVDARFAELVARFDEDAPPTTDEPLVGNVIEPVDDDPPPDSDDPTAGRMVSGYADPLADDDEPFVPPTPPPFPRGSKRSRWGWAGALGCPLVYFLMWGTGRQPDSFTSFLLAVGFVAGAGVLVSGMRTTGPDEDDDGAVV